MIYEKFNEFESKLSKSSKVLENNEVLRLCKNYIYPMFVRELNKFNLNIWFT